MKKFIMAAILVTGVALFAQPTNYYTNGRYTGWSNRMGNTTSYYNSNGTSAGWSTRMGNTVNHYNSNGTYRGSSNFGY